MTATRLPKFLTALCAVAMLAASSAAGQQSQIEPNYRSGYRAAPRVPDMVLRHRLLAPKEVSAFQACKVAQQEFPGSVCLAIRRILPSGDFLVTVRMKNKVRRVRVNGRTGARAA